MHDKYAAALAELDQLHADGKLSPSQYELHKQRLLREAESKRGRGMKALLTVGIVIALFIAIVLVSNALSPR